MPTWKLQAENELRFYHLCSKCNENSSDALVKAGWQKIRDGEPVSCIECTRKCALSAKGLWGAEDKVRYLECEACSEYAACPLQGRYYC